jgi:hypothetical protein
VTRMGDRRGAHKDLVANPDGKKPLGRPRRRWDDNIKTSLRSGLGTDGLIDLPQDRDRW